MLVYKKTFIIQYARYEHKNIMLVDYFLYVFRVLVNEVKS